MSEERKHVPSQFLAVALEAASKAETVIMDYYSGRIASELKSDGTPVTVADTEAERVIIETITNEFPDHGFLGEESGDTHSSSPYVWIIDPIDGTKNYIRRIPLFATQIALMRENELILGVSNAPAMTELLHAEKDCGAFLNNQRVNVTDVGRFDEAMICHGGLKYFNEKGILTNLFILANDAHRTRGFGDCYMYHLLASGRADAVIEAAISIWDIAALTVIVEEAGGKVTDLQGATIDKNTDSILATNGLLHQQILVPFDKTLDDAV